MITKKILNPDRVRHPQGRFSFIPHRFLLDGFFKSLSTPEQVLYFFLSLAADKNGISYYGPKSICTQLHLDEDVYRKALEALLAKDLVAYDGRLFQVLSLPDKPVKLHRISPCDIKALCKAMVKEVP